MSKPPEDIDLIDSVLCFCERLLRAQMTSRPVSGTYEERPQSGFTLQQLLWQVGGTVEGEA